MEKTATRYYDRTDDEERAEIERTYVSPKYTAEDRERFFQKFKEGQVWDRANPEVTEAEAKALINKLNLTGWPLTTHGSTYYVKPGGNVLDNNPAIVIHSWEYESSWRVMTATLAAFTEGLNDQVSG